MYSWRKGGEGGKEEEGVDHDISGVVRRHVAVLTGERKR